MDPYLTEARIKWQATSVLRQGFQEKPQEKWFYVIFKNLMLDVGLKSILFLQIEILYAGPEFAPWRRRKQNYHT